MTTSDPITVVGSGLAGALLGLYLAEAGYGVELYERRSDPRQGIPLAGRSINLALSVRGLHALAGVNLAEEALTRAIPMPGRMLHGLDGSLTFQPYGKDEHEVIYSISRAWLNELLIGAAEARGVHIHFQHRCTRYDVFSSTLHLYDEVAQCERQVKAQPVLGADGAGSALRKTLIEQPRVNYAQDYLAYGYKELTIPPGPDGGFQMEPHALHIWPRNTYMLIALPNPDATFTCTLFFPFDGPDSFASLTTPEAVTAFFAVHFPDALALIPDLATAFFANPTGTLATIHCDPWYIDDQLLLLGDAAHAIVPFFGQGMNCAFEDCHALAAQLQAHGPDWPKVFQAFYAQRKPNADAIATLALENFIEMRDTVANPRFLLRKQVEHRLEKAFPGRFVSKYGMVSFHRVPYATALARGRLQDAMLDQLCQDLRDPADLDLALAEALILSLEAQAPPLAALS
jgi:kynurenine 3-monooxygenase